MYTGQSVVSDTGLFRHTTCYLTLYMFSIFNQEHNSRIKIIIYLSLTELKHEYSLTTYVKRQSCLNHKSKTNTSSQSSPLKNQFLSRISRMQACVNVLSLLLVWVESSRVECCFFFQGDYRRTGSPVYKLNVLQGVTFHLKNLYRLI